MTKFNQGAVKYEIAMSLSKNKCVWISSPHKGAKHDFTIFCEGLKYKVAAGKFVIADRGYQSKKPDELMTSSPSRLNKKEVHNFESCARLRQETFNGRLKKYQILSETFKNTVEKHQLAFEAVCVTIQYQLDNGGILFDI